MTDTCQGACELGRQSTADADAVRDLFHRYRDRLLRMIAFRLDSRVVGKVDCEDVLQDAFVETVRRIGDYLQRPSVPVFIWLRQITSQVLIDTHRRFLGAQMRDVNRELALCWGGCAGAGSTSLAAQLANSLTSPSQVAVRKETISKVKTALGNLEEADREVLVLRHLEDLSNNEVACLLGIDKCAASKRYIRALKRLRLAMSADQ
jgi:RNA polymerase sigma-70 factor (ECF subfamily)